MKKTLSESILTELDYNTDIPSFLKSLDVEPINEYLRNISNLSELQVKYYLSKNHNVSGTLHLRLESGDIKETCGPLQLIPGKIAFTGDIYADDDYEQSGNAYGWIWLNISKEATITILSLTYKNGKWSLRPSK